jgi:hypothetical protein
MEYRAAITDLLRACEQFEEQIGWDGTRAYVDSSDEKHFDEAREAAARVAAPLVDKEGEERWKAVRREASLFLRTGR